MTQGLGQEPHRPHRPHGPCPRGTTRVLAPCPPQQQHAAPQTSRPFPLGRRLSDALWGEGKPNGAQPPTHPTGSSWGQREMVTSRADPTPGLLPALNELQLGPSSDTQGVLCSWGRADLGVAADSQPSIHAKARAGHGFPQSCQSRCGHSVRKKKPKSK